MLLECELFPLCLMIAQFVQCYLNVIFYKSIFVAKF